MWGLINFCQAAGHLPKSSLEIVGDSFACGQFCTQSFIKVPCSAGLSVCLGTYHLQVWSTCPQSWGGVLRGPHFGWVSLLPHCHPQPHRKWFFVFFPSVTQQGSECTFSPMVNVDPVAGWSSASGSTGSHGGLSFGKIGATCG